MSSVEHGRVTRRGVLAGAAWATPAVLIATAAPAAASSTRVELKSTTRTGDGQLTVQYDAPPGATVSITFTWNASDLHKVSSVSGASLTASTGNSATIQFTVPAGGTGSLVVEWGVKKSPAPVSGVVTSTPTYPRSPASFSVAVA